MLTAMRTTVRLMEPGTRGRWAILLILAVVVSLFEVVGAFLIFVLLGLVTAPTSPVDVPFIGDVRNILPGESQDTTVTLMAVFIAFFFLLRGVVYLLQSYLQNRVAHNTGVRLSTRLLRGYMRMPYARHLNRNSAELIRNSFSAPLDIVTGVLVPAIAVVSESLIVLGILVALLLLAPAVTLGMGAAIGAMVLLLLRIIQPRMAALGALNQTAIHDSYKVLQQSLQGVRDIKVLGREAFFERLYARSREAGARTSYLRSVLLDAPRAVIESVLVLLIVAVLVVAVRSSTSTEEVLGVLGVFAYGVLRVLPSVNRIVANGNSIRYGSAAVEHVLKDLDALDTAPWRAQEQIRATPFQKMIAFNNVSFRYSPEADPVLSDININMARGTSLAIVGTTGAGKSTLLDLLLGLLEPTQGAVTVDGVDIREDLPAWQVQLGVVSQTIFLVDDTLRRNIALGERDDAIDEARLSDAVRTAQLEGFVKTLEKGLETEVGERGARLSGGQRQRVAIARALYREPSVLVFDEGTSALDTRTEAALVAALEGLRGQRTVITVAHRLSTVRNHDQILLLEHGRLAAMGTYEELRGSNASFREIAG